MRSRRRRAARAARLFVPQAAGRGRGSRATRRAAPGGAPRAARPSPGAALAVGRRDPNEVPVHLVSPLCREGRLAAPSAQRAPRAKSEISCGVAVSKPTTSSIPGSSGSAIEKPFETMPTTTSRASMPDAGGSRGEPGPGARRPPRSPSRCRSRTCRSPARVPARTASAVRSRCRRTAGRTPSSRRRRAAAAARSPAASGRRVTGQDLATALLEAALPAKKPTISYCVSVAAVTRASAADASRGVRPGTPATSPPGHRARHVEREQQALAGRLDVAERRVERGVERVDDLAHRGPLAAGRGHRDRTRTCEARRAGRSGAHAPCGCALRRRAARPPSPCRPSPARGRRRASSSPGCGSAPSSACPSSSASQTSGEVRCSGWSASRGRRYSRTSAAVSRAVAAAWARAKPSTSRGRPSVSPPRTIHSNRRACSSETSSVGLPAPTRRAG